MNPRLSMPAALGALLICAMVSFAAIAAAQTAKAPASFEQIKWDALMPKAWDPMAGFDLPAGGLLIDDGDPRSQELMRKMREAWDKAPVEPRMDGAAVKLPGYVVPLEEAGGGLSEFLLVPYFGACIHTPPPPANQIIHVVADPAVKGLRSMDPVWASGVLSTQRHSSEMGVSGYRMKAVRIEPYVAPQRR